MERAVFFSIFPDIPSGPDALLVSTVRSRLKTSSSEQSINHKCWESASLNGGIAEMKFWESTSLSKAVLPTFEETSSEPFFRVGIWLDAFFRNFTVFQNCLLPWLDILFRWSLFDCLSMFTKQPGFSVMCTSSTWIGSLFPFLFYRQCFFSQFLLWCSCSSMLRIWKPAWGRGYKTATMLLSKRVDFGLDHT